MLYLGYNNTRFNDGAGAQIQRILGVHAVSRLLGCGYIHFGLGKIGYQGLSVLETGTEIATLNDWYNSLIQLPSDRPSLEGFSEQMFMADQPDLATILQLKEQTLLSGRDVLLTMLLPYSIADQFPGCYASVRGAMGPDALQRFTGAFEESFASEFNAPSAPGHITVGVHVRRGELFAVDSDRMLPNSYYIAVCKALAALFQRMGKTFHFDLYTEVPQKEFDVSGASHGIWNRITENIKFSADQVGLHEFTEIPEVRFRVNEHQITTLYNLGNCDVLVGSRSSFSYVAAVAGTVKHVLLPKFWHSLLPDWVETSPATGEFDHALLEQRLRAAL